MAKIERTQFPMKRAGEHLSADHINAISQAVSDLIGVVPGSFQDGWFSKAGRGTSGSPYFVKNIVVITSVVDSEGVYEVQPRYYDHTEGRWHSDTNSGPYYMDSRDLGTTYEVDDKVVAYWDEQRAAFIPTASGEGKPATTTDGELVCGYNCFWIGCDDSKPAECYSVPPYTGGIYRGVVLEQIDPADEYCTQTITKKLPAFFVHDFHSDEVDTSDPEIYCEVQYPDRLLSPGDMGWVKKIKDKHTCRYVCSGVEIEETLPLYQWCYISLRQCPLPQQTVTGFISSASCETVNGITFTLNWQDTIEPEPENLEDCVSLLPGFSLAQNNECVGFWVGEFSVETEHTIRCLGVTFDTPDGAYGPNQVGGIHVNWCTGELIQLYIDLGEGGLIPYNDEYTNLQRNDAAAVKCYLLYTGPPDPDTDLPTPAKEAITYRYRVIMVCSEENGLLSTPNICVEHIFPPCHDCAGNAIPDFPKGRESLALCDSNLVTSYGFDWGNGAGTSCNDGPIGLWESAAEQVEDHRFGGCFNELEEGCGFAHILTDESWTLTLTW